MKIEPAKRIASLPEYAFKLVDDKVSELRAMNASPIDLGVGDPTTPTPQVIRTRLKTAVDEHATSGYPSYIGSMVFRESVAAWSKKRFSCDLDPTTEVSVTVGSKEGVFNFHEGFVNPGDVVLVPSPGYPPYSRGTLFAEGKPWFYPLEKQNGFVPDLEAIPADVVKAAKIIWINYPNSPSGACPPIGFFEKLYSWAQDNEIIIASDEAYSEIYYGDTPPPSMLQAGREGVIIFNSLSKRSAMTGYRVGWVAGDKRIIDVFKKTKTNIDSGAPSFILDAAMAALQDDAHVVEMRAEYAKKKEILISALNAAGLPDSTPEGTVFIWQKAPEGMTSMELATILMDPEVALVTIPGALISETCANGRNPGEGYVRFSLTPTLEDIQIAASRLKGLKL